MEGDPPLTVGSEVELVEQCVTVEPLAEDTLVPLSRSAALHGILPQCSTSTGRLVTFPQHSHHSSSLVVKEDGRAYDMEVEDGFEGVSAISPVKSEATHLVAIIPSHVRLSYWLSFLYNISKAIVSVSHKQSFC